MRNVWNIMLKGLVVVLPIGLTLYFIYWLGMSVEKLLRSMMILVLPETYYWPGMGLVVGVVLLFFIGLVVNAWVVRRILRLGERLLEQIPLIKSVYGALRDFIGFFSPNEGQHDLQQVVMVSIDQMRLIGFLTAENAREFLGESVDADTVAVYLPMSYQIGGYTLYLPRTSVTPLDLSVEEAMRRVLTAGLSKSHR